MYSIVKAFEKCGLLQCIILCQSLSPSTLHLSPSTCGISFSLGDCRRQILFKIFFFIARFIKQKEKTVSILLFCYSISTDVKEILTQSRMKALGSTFQMGLCFHWGTKNMFKPESFSVCCVNLNGHLSSCLINIWKLS